MKAWLKRISWGGIALVGFGAAGGILVGILVARAPIEINTEIDISSLVSLLALFTATLVVPFIINNYLSNLRNKKAILATDIDEVLKLLGEMRDMYEAIYSIGATIQVKDQRTLLLLTRKVNNRIDLLCEQTESDDKLGDLKIDISLLFNKQVLPAFTEKFLPGQIIEEIDCIRAINEVEDLIVTLKKKRYGIYD